MSNSCSPDITSDLNTDRLSPTSPQVGCSLRIGLTDVHGNVKVGFRKRCFIWRNGSLLYARPQSAYMRLRWSCQLHVFERFVRKNLRFFFWRLTLFYISCTLYLFVPLSKFLLLFFIYPNIKHDYKALLMILQ